MKQQQTKQLEEIVNLLKKRDYALIDKGIEKLRLINRKRYFELLLKDCNIDQNGRLRPSILFTGPAPAQPFLDYAVWNLIGYAPEDAKISNTLRRSIHSEIILSKCANHIDSYRIEKFPEGLLEFHNLVELDCSEARVKYLPEGISSLQKLEKLDLDYNSCGSLPAGLFQLTSLVELSVVYNGLKEISPEIQNLKQLKKLNIRNNRIKTIPAEFSKLHTLTELDLSYNEITSIKGNSGGFDSLTKLDLTENRLETLPRIITLMPKLTHLSLKENYLKEIPPAFCRLTHLEFLDLSGNRKLAKMPSDLFKLEKLTKLSFIACKELETKPPYKDMSKRSTIIEYQNKLLRKENRELFRLRKQAMNESLQAINESPVAPSREETKPEDQLSTFPGKTQEPANELLKFFHSRNYQLIDYGIELLRSLQAKSIYEFLLSDCSITESGKVEFNRKIWSYDGHSNMYNTYTFWNLVSFAPKNVVRNSNCKNFKQVRLTLGTDKETGLPKIENLKALERLTLYLGDLKSIPDEIGCLSNLKELYIYGPQIARLPQTIGNLKKLRVLELETEKLEELPEEFGALNKLEKLTIKISDINKLPHSFIKLQNLKQLSFSSYGRHLQSLDELQHLIHLEELVITLCPNLTTLPSIWHLPKLTTLSLYNIGIKSPPDSFATTGSLKNLNIEYCWHLDPSGSLPKVIWNLKKLQSLSITRSNLNELPFEIGKLTELKKLDLSDNKLRCLPASIGNLRKLSELDLSFNELETIPHEMFNLKKLEILYLHAQGSSRMLKNSTLTSIPLEIKKLKKLKRLNVTMNAINTRILQNYLYNAVVS